MKGGSRFILEIELPELSVNWMGVLRKGRNQSQPLDLMLRDVHMENPHRKGETTSWRSEVG